MPDFSGRLGCTESWTTSGSPEQVLAAIVAVVEQRGGRTEALGESEVEFLLGSRSTYRLLGMVSPVSSRPIRLSVVVIAESGDVVRIEADAKSDVGWYLMNVTSLSSRQFEKAFDQLFDALRLAAPDASAWL
jgi:hypothetical protein